MTRRSILLVVAIALLCGVATFVVQSSRDPVFVAQTLVAVDAPSAMNAAGGRPDNVVFLARSYATRADIAPVVDDAIERSGLELSRRAVREATAARVSTQDATLRIEARAPVGEEARTLAGALTDALTDYIRDEQLAHREERLAPLDERIRDVEAGFSSAPEGSPRRGALDREYQALVAERASVQVEPLDRLVVLSPAELPTAPVSPRPMRDSVIAFVLGGALAAEALIGWRMFRSDRQPDM